MLGVTELDAAGGDAVFARYAGILPCADCPALRMDLTLRVNAAGAPTTYEQRMTYVDRRGADKVVESAGHWAVVHGSRADARALLYRLTEARSRETQLLRVDGERAVRLVDDGGRDLPSPLPQVLWRLEPRLTGAPVAVGKAEENRMIRLQPGQELIVQLAGNRTTGYQWTMAEEREPVVAITATPAYKTGGAAPGMVGVGGVETWRLFAFRPGAQRLAFEYRRAWEKDVAPAQTVSYAIEVEPR